LTVGDGLVTQIPALLMSTATGIIVTRASDQSNLSAQVSEQLAQYPKLLYVAAGTIFLLGLTPINFMLTTLIAGLLAFTGFMVQRQQTEPEIPEPEEEIETESSEMKSPENVVQLLSMDSIEFEFGYALIPLADTNQGGDLLDRIVMIRRQLAIELGVVIPV